MCQLPLCQRWQWSLSLVFHSLPGSSLKENKNKTNSRCCCRDLFFCIIFEIAPVKRAQLVLISCAFPGYKYIKAKDSPADQTLHSFLQLDKELVFNPAVEGMLLNMFMPSPWVRRVKIKLFCWRSEWWCCCVVSQTHSQGKAWTPRHPKVDLYSSFTVETKKKEIWLFITAPNSSVINKAE